MSKTVGWTRLDDIPLQGRRILTRVDYNVPIVDGIVQDLTRIERSKPTLDAIITKGGIPIVISHLGRPKSSQDKSYSLKALVQPISDIMGATVWFSDTLLGPEAHATIHRANPGDIVLLENLRFDSREQKNDTAFAAALGELGDVYCNDAFSASHRSHASIVAITRYLPACVGRLMETELNALTQALSRPQRPLFSIVGGSKISTKINLIDHLLDTSDTLFVGGAMANTFRAAQGKSVGLSLVEPEMLDVARTLIAKATHSVCQLVLPIDWTIAAQLDSGSAFEFITDESECPADRMIVDIGPKTSQQIEGWLQKSRTLIWNGPVGAFEIHPFHRGTDALSKAIAALTEQNSLLSFAGGGDTISALNAAQLLDKLTYVSTAGGAFLEWMEGRSLPGIVALMPSKSMRGSK